MKTIICDPDVVNFTKSFKSIGYNHYSAILDLIDNSVSAGSTKIWIDYIADIKGNFKIIIADNGCGMDRNKLFEAMRIASSDPTMVRLGTDLGKFGLGLKLASFSQTDRFSIISQEKEKEINSFTWDLNFVRAEKKWLLQETDELKFSKLKSHGTEVVLYDVFSGMDIIEDQIIAKLRSHIAVSYHLMKGIKFLINDKEIDPIDPFFSDSLASNHSSIEKVYLDSVSLEIQSHQVPHENKMKPREKRLFFELTEISIGPGLYIYRKNRLIAWSGWEGLGKNLRINDLYRMSVFCQEDADDLFNIEVKKSQISVTEPKLRNLLKSSIIHFTEIARRPYQKRAVLSLKDLSNIWQLERNSNEKVVFKLNKESDLVKLAVKGQIKLSELLETIESTLPYESLLYYLNLNKLDSSTINLKKIETAELMFKMGLMTINELEKLKEKYGH